MKRKLSIIIPVYNEEKTILLILKKILSTKLINNFQKEIIVVNDGSKDKSGELINRFIRKNSKSNIIYIKQKKNLGKGAAIHRGIKSCSGKYTIIQDADLEYNPSDYNKLLKKIIREKGHVVYGSRYLNKKLLWAKFGHTYSNKILTFYSNLLTGYRLTDVHTCYKLFKTATLKSISLEEKDFAFCPEITMKLSRKRIPIYETSVSYKGRSFKEGKKINAKDGLKALLTTLKYRIK